MNHSVSEAIKLRSSSMYCKQSTENRHVSSISCADKSFKSQHIFMSEKILCLEEAGTLHSARMKICIFEPFPS